MPHHLPIGAFVPVLFAPLLGGLVIWTSIYIAARQRKAGRMAVEAKLASLGETPISIEFVPITKLASHAGLTAMGAFRISARLPDGREATHEWAYQPSLLTTGRGAALKYLTKSGIWIALA